jgi:hypothetical protein
MLQPNADESVARVQKPFVARTDEISHIAHFLDLRNEKEIARSEAERWCCVFRRLLFLIIRPVVQQLL